MVQKLSEQIRECYHHAEDCFRQAKDQGDPKIRNDFLDCERRWLRLARSYELVERISKTRSSAIGRPQNSAEL